MTELAELKEKIDQALKQGTNVISQLKLAKVVPDERLIDIIKSEGVISAEEAHAKDRRNIQALFMARENQAHPKLNNVIYAIAVKTVDNKVNQEDLENIQKYGGVTLIIKDSVLQRPNTTYSYFDTGLQLQENRELEFYQGQLLTESEIIKSKEMGSVYLEVQIRSKISLGEIERIIKNKYPPTTEEIELANQTGIPLEYKGIVVAGTLPEQPAITPLEPIRPIPEPLPLPIVTSPLISPPVLPEFPDYPKVLPPISTPKPLEPSDPMPADRIPNFKEFKGIDPVCDWLEMGKDITVDFPPSRLPPTVKFCVGKGNAGVWYEGKRYLKEDL